MTTKTTTNDSLHPAGILAAIAALYLLLWGIAQIGAIQTFVTTDGVGKTMFAFFVAFVSAIVFALIAEAVSGKLGRPDSKVLTHVLVRWLGK